MISKKLNSKSVLVCRKCGYIKEIRNRRSIKENIKKKPLDDVVIVDKKTSTLPTTKVKCGKCGNDEAYWWLQQMRSGDEPPTIFFRCTKCGHTWRQY